MSFRHICFYIISRFGYLKAFLHAIIRFFIIITPLVIDSVEFPGISDRAIQSHNDFYHNKKIGVFFYLSIDLTYMI